MADQINMYNFLRTLILPYVEIDKNLPSAGNIIDLGCGQGILARYLAAKNSRSVVGVDKDIDRLPKSKLKNLHFKSEDITKYEFSKVDGIVLSDVLHHLNRQDQKKILKKIYLKIRKNGILVIKEIDTGEFIRSKLSRFWDFVFYPNDKIYFSNSQDLKKFLNILGFKVKILRCTKFFPGSTTLLICKKS